MPLLIVQQPANQNVPLALQTLIALRRTPSPKEDASLTIDQRYAKLRKEGFVALGLNEVGVQAYADPALVSGSTMASVGRLLGLFRPNTPVKALAPEDLGPEERRALATAMANSPFADRFRAAPPESPFRVSLAGSVYVSLNVDGRTVEMSYDPPIYDKPSDPVTFPKGLDLPPRSEAMVVEWLGMALPGAFQDEWTLKAFTALKVKRKEARDAFSRSISLAARRTLTDDEVPRNANRLSALPEALQEDLRDAMRRGFQVYGFKSEQQGLDALENGRLSDLRFGGTVCVFRPGSQGILGFDLRGVRF